MNYKMCRQGQTLSTDNCNLLKKYCVYYIVLNVKFFFSELPYLKLVNYYLNPIASI